MIKDQPLSTQSSQVGLMNLEIRMLLEQHILPGPTEKLRSKTNTLAHLLRIFFEQANCNWSDVAPEFAFALNTTANTSAGLTPYKIVFGQKPQIPLSLKLGLLMSSDLTCNSEFCKDLPLHQHSEQSSKNDQIDKLLKPKLSSSLIARENQFKQFYRTAYKRSLQVNSKPHQNRNKHKLGKPLDVGQLVLMENHSFEDGKSRKLYELRSGPYEVAKT